ncbi:hypothetical protein ENSA5_05050 [Enhygromyxa salina]|uniref:Uncharacterized protein n=1 Tax=Enhygromyxa salina TaxID=215803 RepID=A0A2S9YI40_9BACT|nr:hypothetical protein [Enhygromyxa salina]PRQ04740.1 hypothetical protein ENSA5_05050 [Enhygromyxa salina]
MARRLVLMAPLLALSCHKVPATLPELDAGSEAARTDAKTFVESQPDTEGGRLFSPISAEVAELYGCWFSSPYEYMFAHDGPPLEINDRSYGMLMAGINGILYYGDLNGCAGQLSGQPPGHYADYRPIEALAGVPATVAGSTLPFDAVNPEIISWARTQLLPAPEQYIEGIPVQLAYERVFQRFFRVMGHSLFYLVEPGTLRTEADAYLRDTSRGADGINWLEGHYSGSIPAYGGGRDGTTMTGPMAAGFWLRRELDGSLPACWHGLRDVLERYDSSWLAELKAAHPTASAALDQLPDPLAPP